MEAVSLCSGTPPPSFSVHIEGSASCKNSSFHFIDQENMIEHLGSHKQPRRELPGFRPKGATLFAGHDGSFVCPMRPPAVPEATPA